MPARTRRSAAVAAAALVADIQMESDPEEEEQVDIENDDDGEGEEGDEDDGAEGDESQSEAEEEEEEEGPAATAPQPRLKITLKLPANNTSSNSAGTATPDDQEMDYLAFTKTPKRRAKTKVIQDIDVESEDPTSQSGSDEEQSGQDPPSRSTGTPSGPGVKPMTTRQAVLASVVDPTHVSLDEGTRSKKQPLNETELALRREETARKRKNLSEKKLEDEKAETINRLLKKQSRPKNKRTNTLDDRSPMPSASGARTPKAKPTAKNAGDEADEAEGDEDEDDMMDVVVEPAEEVKPVMYRWVSSLRVVPSDDKDMDKDKDTEKVVQITLSVPEIVFARAHPDPQAQQDESDSAELERIRKARGPGVCAVDGCGKPRKYRLPRDWTIGACDSTHLRVIANRV
ncbi:hypothetical protein CVT25_007406 [Psilocybe cyanescens]|uniref:INO80 complex subunit B-like conserved region domain-containing protein n=1 Tax=Psilocybe cyanescens TaxID=93625 RepID=A0A409XGC4_PSICY|nr:hypothetical protein CVT25_007406 [Psilocybe cyanescens]